MKARNLASLDAEIAALENLGIDELQARWRDFYGVEPPKKIRAGFLKRAIAHRLQEKAHGALKPALRRKLARIAKDLAGGGGVVPQPGGTLAPGTRLMREWNGETQIVEVTESGFCWRGEAYPSLSAVAGAITGSRWSGPRFFGLKDNGAVRAERGQ